MAKKSKFNLDAYPFFVRPLTEEDGGGFLCEYPDIQKCYSDGETPQEAIREGRDALESTLRTYEELGIAIPQPGSSGPSGKFHQRIPKSLHARLVERAAREGVSLNTLVTAMIAEGIGKRDKRPDLLRGRYDGGMASQRIHQRLDGAAVVNTTTGTAALTLSAELYAAAAGRS